LATPAWGRHIWRIDALPNIVTGDSPIEDALKAIEMTIRTREIEWKELLAAKDIELGRLRAARDALRRLVSSEVSGPEKVSPRVSSIVKGRGVTSDLVRQIARLAMEEEGKPLNRAQILERLIAEGVSVSAPNPGKFINKVMWRSSEFEHVGTGYWLTGRPLPE
jgi:hypothetical protein